MSYITSGVSWWYRRCYRNTLNYDNENKWVTDEYGLYGFQMPLWKGGFYLEKESLRFDIY